MPQRFQLHHALLPIVATILCLIATLGIWHSSLFWPSLAVGALTAGVVAWRGGMSLSAIRKAALAGLRSTVLAVTILLLIGALIGVWKAAGTVPALVYYGLQFAVPQYLVPTAFLLALATSMLLGTSIGTLSTLGVAIMGIAHGVGAPLDLVAGALVSGALFGDRSSPLSGSLNINTTITDTDLRTAMRALAPTGILTAVLTLAGYWLLGQSAHLTAAGDAGAVRTAIATHFTISGWALLPPVLVLALSLLRLPVRHALAIGIAGGVALAALAGGHGLGTPALAALLGNQPHTGVADLDRLFGGGGIVGMIPQVALLLAAGAMNGIMEATGLMALLIRRLTAGVRRPLSLTAVTMATSTAVSAVAANQALAIIVPGRMLRPAFAAMGLPPERLSRALADSGTVLAGLIPWNVMGLLATAALGIPARSWAPYALLGWLLPLVSLAWTALEERRGPRARGTEGGTSPGTALGNAAAR